MSEPSPQQSRLRLFASVIAADRGSESRHDLHDAQSVLECLDYLADTSSPRNEYRLSGLAQNALCAIIRMKEPALRLQAAEDLFDIAPGLSPSEYGYARPMAVACQYRASNLFALLSDKGFAKNMDGWAYEGIHYLVSCLMDQQDSGMGELAQALLESHPRQFVQSVIRLSSARGGKLSQEIIDALASMPIENTKKLITGQFREVAFDMRNTFGFQPENALCWRPLVESGLLSLAAMQPILRGSYHETRMLSFLDAIDNPPEIVPAPVHAWGKRARKR